MRRRARGDTQRFASGGRKEGVGEEAEGDCRGEKGGKGRNTGKDCGD